MVLAEYNFSIQYCRDSYKKKLCYVQCKIFSNLIQIITTNPQQLFCVWLLTKCIHFKMCYFGTWCSILRCGCGVYGVKTLIIVTIKRKMDVQSMIFFPRWEISNGLYSRYQNSDVYSLAAWFWFSVDLPCLPHTVSSPIYHHHQIPPSSISLVAGLPVIYQSGLKLEQLDGPFTTTHKHMSGLWQHTSSKIHGGGSILIPLFN